uniref:Uncharacterized protein n=1 Tax=Arundo donax TaxID=35708 RepID=A0A0A9EIM3_ARUDO
MDDNGLQVTYMQKNLGQFHPKRETREIASLTQKLLCTFFYSSSIVLQKHFCCVLIFFIFISITFYVTTLLFNVGDLDFDSSLQVHCSVDDKSLFCTFLETQRFSMNSIMQIHGNLVYSYFEF